MNQISAQIFPSGTWMIKGYCHWWLLTQVVWACILKDRYDVYLFYYSKTKKPFPAVCIMMYLLAKDGSRLFLLQLSFLFVLTKALLCLGSVTWPAASLVLHPSHQKRTKRGSLQLRKPSHYHLNHKGFKKLKTQGDQAGQQLRFFSQLNGSQIR